MAKGGRPSKYPWDKIRAEYEIGKTQAYLCNKYEIKPSTLSGKIKEQKWVVSEVAINAISEFSQVSENLVKVIEHSNENVGNAIQEQITHDIKVLAKERKLDLGGLDILMGVASLTTKNIREAIEEKKSLKPHELKAYADIGEKVRGKAGKPTNQVNIQNTTNVAVIPTIADMYDEQGKLCP